MERLCVMNKSTLLEHIRTLQREVDSLMDMVIAMEDAEPPVQCQQGQQEAFSDKWLNVRQVCEFLNISQTTFYEGIRSGVFPKGNVFGPKTIRWRISDIAAWQTSKQAREDSAGLAARRGKPSRIRKIGEFVHV